MLFLVVLNMLFLVFRELLRSFTIFSQLCLFFPDNFDPKDVSYQFVSY